MPHKLPLPRGFFQCPPMDADATATLIHHATNGLKTMVELARFQGGPVTWTLDSECHGVQQYSGSGPYAPPGSVLTLNVTNVKGSLDDAAALMRMTTHEDFATYCAAFAEDVVDCASLYTLREPTFDTPREYVGVKWKCYASPTSLVKSRDVCYVEAHQDVEMKHGLRGWARCMQSIDLACCPNLQASHDLVRAWLHYGGYLFTETTTPGELQVIYVQCIDYRGQLPQFLTKLSAKHGAKTLLTIQKHFHRTRNQTLSSSSSSNSSFVRVTPRRSRKCMLCTFGPQMKCAVCHQVVCMNCNRYHKMTTPNGRKDRVCYDCSAAPRQTRSGISDDDDLYDTMGSKSVVSLDDVGRHRHRGSMSTRFGSRPMCSPFGLERKSERYGPY
ncbi:Aste57867_8476 [Aphanomyces stellatus]|uniref:Aste57867_8476 protein n=1 Tax=Aphanomyces stellatus TaxID=120398 RepID=A0A485KKF4_9STRA|nr:hypothetical protein As57867_008444 [Aphanomyces stellatus]VFT85362.1 Aste57867_8476 [Aphanomyces stellatus]